MSKVIVSPGYTLASSPSAKVLTKARSKISSVTSSGSESSSSPPSLSIVSSVGPLTSPPASLLSSASGVESKSVGLSPNSSSAEEISATLTSWPPVVAASTVNSILTVSEAPGAKGPAIFKVVAPVAVKPAGT